MDRILIPYAGAVAALREHPTALSHAALACVTVGIRPEVDVNRLPTPLRELLLAYLTQTASCHATVDVGLVLAHGTQLYSKRAKHDLTQELHVLKSWSITRDVADEFLSSTADNAVECAERNGWHSVRGDDGTVTVSRTLEPSGWPDEFGGPPWPNETARTLELTLRFAKWRDRRLRRLAKVKVVSTSRWSS